MKTPTIVLLLGLAACDDPYMLSGSDGSTPSPAPASNLPQLIVPDSDADQEAPAPIRWDEAGVTMKESFVWEVHYSPAVAPDVGCTSAVVSLLDGAGTKVKPGTIRLSAYGFTSPEVSDALVRAHARGVDVQVVLDRSDRTAKNTKAPDLQAAGIPVVFDARHAIMHDKYVIVDGYKVEMGSFNYTTAAQKSNAENCLLLAEDRGAPALSTKYAVNWQLHHDHSAP